MNMLAMIIFVVFGLIFGGITITMYVLRALGLYKLAKNKKINNAWLAWIPVGDSYIMGALSEDSPFVKSKIPKIRIILPIMYGIYFILCTVPSIIMLTSPFMYAPSPSSLGYLPFAFWGMYVFVFLFMLIIIAALVFVHYHIFKTYDPNNAVLYTILSAFGFSFIFIFVIRNKQPAFSKND